MRDPSDRLVLYRYRSSSSQSTPSAPSVRSPAQRASRMTETYGYRQPDHLSSPRCRNYGHCCSDQSAYHSSAVLTRHFESDRTSVAQIPAQAIRDRPRSRRTSDSSLDHRKPTFNFLVAGGTGVGKSSFINTLSRDGPSRARVGRTLQSCTSEIECFPCVDHRGRRYNLIDTPGFDDSRISDAEVLSKFARFLSDLYARGQKIHGVIFMHRITDVRLAGSAIRTAQIIRKICGEHFRGFFAFVTSMWDLVLDRDSAMKREAELSRHSQFWGGMWSENSRVFRIHDSELPAQKVIRWFLDDRRRSSDSTPILQLGKEILCGLSVWATEAGEFVGGELSKQRQRHAEAVSALERDIIRAERHDALESVGPCEPNAVCERHGSRHADVSESRMRLMMPDRKELCQ